MHDTTDNGSQERRNVINIEAQQSYLKKNNETVTKAIVTEQHNAPTATRGLHGIQAITRSYDARSSLHFVCERFLEVLPLEDSALPVLRLRGGSPCGGEGLPSMPGVGASASRRWSNTSRLMSSQASSSAHLQSSIASTSLPVTSSEHSSKRMAS